MIGEPPLGEPPCPSEVVGLGLRLESIIQAEVILGLCALASQSRSHLGVFKRDQFFFLQRLNVHTYS